MSNPSSRMAHDRYVRGGDHARIGLRGLTVKPPAQDAGLVHPGGVTGPVAWRFGDEPVVAPDGKRVAFAGKDRRIWPPDRSKLAAAAFFASRRQRITVLVARRRAPASRPIAAITASSLFAQINPRPIPGSVQGFVTRRSGLQAANDPFIRQFARLARPAAAALRS